MSRNMKIILSVVGILVVGVIGLQLVPNYERTNPPVTYQMKWNAPETEQLMRQACYDCHSNETVWPWYSNIAPVSWLVVKDVNEGRAKLNFSTGHGEMESDELIEQIERGTMPPRIYLTMHSDANLTDTQKADLIAGIRASLRGG